MTTLDYVETASPYFAEFLGTLVISAVFGFNAVGNEMVWIPTSVAAAITACTYASAAVSGGHLNPAISVAFGIAGKCPWLRVLGYCAVQVLAGICGIFMTQDVFPRTVRVGPRQGFTGEDTAVVEIAFTVAYCFVALNCMAAKSNQANSNQFFGLAIGFVTVAGGHSAAPVSGGFFNPAVVLGLGFCGSSNLAWCIMYVCCHLLAACIAVVIFRLVRPDDMKFSWETDSQGQEGTCLLPDHYPKKFDDKSYENVFRMSAVASELVGSYFIVFTYILSNFLQDNRYIDTSAGCWATGAMVMCMVYCLGTVSGGHFNPAITWAVLRSDRWRLSAIDAMVYVIAQISGSILAAISAAALQPQLPILQLRVLQIQPSMGRTWASVCLGEGVFTFALCLVTLAMCSSRRMKYVSLTESRSFHSGLAIGMSFAAGLFALRGISGGHLNSATSIGLFSTGFLLPGTGVLSLNAVGLVIFVACQMTAGVLAGTFFRMLHPKEYEFVTTPDADLPKRKQWRLTSWCMRS